MASGHLLGDARIESGSTVHLLAVPLLDIALANIRPRAEWWSADARNRSVVSFGDGAQEILATIRCENDPQGLAALLQDAIENDVTINYLKTESGDPYPCKVVAVPGSRADDIRLEPDRERYGFGEYQCQVVLRRVDGGTWAGVVGPESS